MGVRTKDRTLLDQRDPGEPKLFIPPEPIDINDDGYRGAHPDDIDYPQQETIASPDGKRTLELRAFTKKGLRELRRTAEEQFLPALEELGLRCAVLCEKRRDSGTGRITLGVCFGAGNPGQRQAIMLRRPDADDPRVAYTLLHEMAHLNADGHGAAFKNRFGELVAYAVSEDTPFTRFRDSFIGLAKGDRYKPTAPDGDWDDYAPTVKEPSYDVALLNEEIPF